MMTSAPASTAAETTSERYPMSVRVASIGENSTLEHRLLAKRTASPARFEDVLAVRAHLVLDVQVAGTHEGVDTRPTRPLHGLPGALDVLLVDAGEPCDGRALHFCGDAGYGFEVALGGDREAGLDHVYLQASELFGYLQLLLDRERDARRLLAVPQCGVEDLYSTHVSHPPTLETRSKCGSVAGGRGQPARYRGW